MTTNYLYDSRGQMITKYATNSAVREVYSYDARGLMIQAKKGDNSPYYDDISVSAMVYDGLGRVTQQDQEVLNSGTTKTVSYDRDQLGQPTAITYPDTAATQINYSYTGLRKIDEVSRGSGTPVELADYDYYGGIVKNRSYNTTSMVTFTPAYDSWGRITTHTTVNASSAGVNFAYTFDNNSNIVTKQFNHRAGQPYNLYGYDRLDRITSATYNDSVDENFTLDHLGNRDGSQDLRGGSVTYAVDTTGNVNQYETIGGQALSYDTRGNLTVDEDGYQYFYDYENRVTQIKDSSNAVVVNYTYDAFGRRIQKDDGVVTRYYYDSQRVLLETDGSQNDQRAYVYGNYIDEVLVMTDYTAQDDPDHFYGQDHLYSAVVLFDDAGAVIERYEYDAYGQVRIMDASYNSRTSSSYGNCYLFTGRRLDTLDEEGALKIYYYRARYYDPETGRFMQRDPLGYVERLNLYGYVSEMPTRYVDPLRLTQYMPGPVTVPTPVCPRSLTRPMTVI